MSPEDHAKRQCFAFRDKAGKVIPLGSPGNTEAIEDMTTAEVRAMLCGDDIRSKGDLREWTGSLPFHLSKE